jgi:paraquat-inducible protein A
MIQKHVGFSFTVVAVLCFVPGIVLPMFVLNMDMSVALTGAGFTSEIVNKELSIIATVSELWQEHRYLVSVLIFAFSVFIPIMKTGLVTMVYFMRNITKQQQLINIVATIGKWSMADVFVVAVFLAILSTSHAQTAQSHELTFFGMNVGFEISTQTLSNVGQGFYYFVAYCVLSLIGSQLILKSISDKKDKNEREDTSLTDAPR